ncbi:hypothetical protein RRG08_009477 [Elysia crispata]|uniref:Uncharacterized protein n=1 Tax=Elysia crispata TaxID=231223 RepID=A0AAE1ASL6_9GAST|nr:hypothetical protein RRG08_009477 [Elysia crispata]
MELFTNQCLSGSLREITNHGTVLQILVVTFSETPTVTFSQILVVTFSETPSVTFSQILVVTFSKTLSVTFSETPSVTFSQILDVTLSETPSVTFSQTLDVTFSETPSVTFSQILVVTFSKTLSVTFSDTLSVTFLRYYCHVLRDTAANSVILTEDRGRVTSTEDLTTVEPEQQTHSSRDLGLIARNPTSAPVTGCAGQMKNTSQDTRLISFGVAENKHNYSTNLIRWYQRRQRRPYLVLDKSAGKIR